jgi:uncharacterized protein
MTILYEYKCPRCGMPLSASQPEFCEGCGAQFVVPAPEEKSIKDTSDPDHPAWGLRAALGLWFFSVLAIVMAPVLATSVWSLVQKVRGMATGLADLQKLFTNPAYILLFLMATFVMQMVTLMAAYPLVTRNGEGFFESLGWRWHPRFRLVHATLFTIAVIIVAIFLSNLLPNRKTDLERLLEVSFSVRVFTALIAVLSAPLVEEVIYRGVLYSALRKNLGIWPAIIGVSVLFVGVHVPQYWGGWGVLAALSLLSFGLTVVRAYSRSLLPCYVIHLLFNAVNAVGIIVEGLVKK